MQYIFLNYINRSGSSFLANTLSRCSEICVCPEGDILFDILCWRPNRTVSIKKWRKKIIPLLVNDFKLQTWNLNTDDYMDIVSHPKNAFELFIKLLNTYQKKHFPQANTIVFKHPEMLHLRTTLENRQNFQLLLLVRDPRAVFESQRQSFLKPYNKIMNVSCTNVIRSYHRMYNYLHNKTAKYHYIKYEDLILNFDKTLENLTAYYALPSFKTWNNSGHYYTSIPQQLMNIHPIIQEPPQAERIHRWKKTIKKSHQQIIEFQCNELMRFFGYSDSKQPLTLKIVLDSIVTGILNLFQQKSSIIRWIKRTWEIWPV